MNSKENDDFGDIFTHESETTLGDDEIDIKHEEMDYHPHYNSTAEDQSGDHSDLSLETKPSIAHVECGHDEADEKDLNNFYHDLFLCERNCETCVTYMRMLSEHVRAAHVPHQPIQDPLLIDGIQVPLTDQSSSSIQIKSEVEENTVKMDCTDSEEFSAPTSDSDPDYNVECDRESDPDYAPSSTQELRHQSEDSATNPSSSQSRSSKPKKESLESREHFKCLECGKSFTRKMGLKLHMSVHTGEKPFKCDLCERTFARSENLIQHKRIHTGVRPYTCNVCEMSFRVSNHLKEHTRIHTGEKPYKCDLCEKRFTRSNNLTEHRRVHTGDKPFKCDVCEKRFKTKGSLTTHKRMHTREKERNPGHGKESKSPDKGGSKSHSRNRTSSSSQKDKERDKEKEKDKEPETEDVSPPSKTDKDENEVDELADAVAVSPTDLTDDISKCEREFDLYLKELSASIKNDYRELLKETKMLNYKTKVQLCENPGVMKDIESMLSKDKRYLQMETMADERDRMLLDFIEDLERKGPPPPPTASEPSRRMKST